MLSRQDFIRMLRPEFSKLFPIEIRKIMSNNNKTIVIHNCERKVREQ